jgi:IS30 family transposase
MTQYTQLSQDERYAISRCIKSNKSKAQLARELNRSRSTFYTEINRNKGLKGYRPKQAHQKAQSRHYKQTSSLTPFACE